MTDQGLSEFKTFAGQISLEGSAYSLNFRARIDSSGEVEFDFGTWPLNKETQFILLRWNGPGHEFIKFGLSGTAEDGTRLFEINPMNQTASVTLVTLQRPDPVRGEPWRLAPEDIDYLITGSPIPQAGRYPAGPRGANEI